MTLAELTTTKGLRKSLGNLAETIERLKFLAIEPSEIPAVRELRAEIDCLVSIAGVIGLALDELDPDGRSADTRRPLSREATIQ